MQDDTPQVIRDIQNPLVDVPMMQLTYYFIDGSNHTITAPAEAFARATGDDAIIVAHNGLTTVIRMGTVKYSEAREVMSKRRKEQGK